MKSEELFDKREFAKMRIESKITRTNNPIRVYASISFQLALNSDKNKKS